LFRNEPAHVRAFLVARISVGMRDFAITSRTSSQPTLHRKTMLPGVSVVAIERI
jgi:hypothetical protein